MTIAEVNKKMYPMAGSFSSQVDKEMTTFTGVIHRDLWNEYAPHGAPDAFGSADATARISQLSRLFERHRQ